MMPVFLLADCTNFYASCEQIFEPALWERPVVVLSNNDGCIISRSEAAKRLGIEMGTPFFKVRSELNQLGVTVRSSNYALYADLSRRVYDTLATFTDEIEPYSIDEAFLRMHVRDQMQADRLMREVKRRVERWTGIPVRVGVGPTKTLAKVASERAKRTGGVAHLMHSADIEATLAGMRPDAIWGIGRRLCTKLNRYGITNALALRAAPDDWIRRQMTVVGLRTVWELRGISCLPLERVPAPRRCVTRSRSFGRSVQSMRELEEAVALHVTRAAEVLRRSRQTASVVQVFIRTSRYAADRAYMKTCTRSLVRPMNHTPSLIRVAREGVSHIYRPGIRYAKCGVHLLDLAPEHPEQGHLFLERNARGEHLMRVVDGLNRRYGRGTVGFAASGTERPWKMRQAYGLRRYTTDWKALPRARV